MSRINSNPKYEDTIQCFFFSIKKFSNEEWRQLCNTINKTIKLLSHEYIWHREEFKVFVPVGEEKSETPQHLMSITCFGDNIEDEWFIVYILIEISKKFPELIIQIEDNDGDFLLIEAADYLPAWANPETTENRVYIYQHCVHIIPPNLVPIDSQVKLNDALRLISGKSEETKAPVDIQEAIFKRINNYPEQIQSNNHRAIVKLPVEIAALLALKPSLVSPLANTFCNLDVLEARLCKDVKVDKFIYAEVKFTKFLYAMLLHRKFPNIFKLKNVAKDERDQFGLKLVYGYKAIMSKTSQDIFATSEYKKFFNSLVKNGYFKGNLEGSKEYKRLLHEAKLFFSNIECPLNSYVCNIIEEMKLTEEYKCMVKTLEQKSNSDILEEDDDAWLNINSDQLNEFLNNQYGRKVKMKNNDPITSHIITSELSNFLKERSDIEGVEEISNKNSDENINFNPDEFASCLEKMLNIVTNKNTEQDLDLSDFSDFDVDDDNVMEVKENLEIDKELSSKLKDFEEYRQKGEKSAMPNLMQSLKEEGLSGPTSSVLRTIGIKKSDILDSDDDDDDDVE